MTARKSLYVGVAVLLSLTQPACELFGGGDDEASAPFAPPTINGTCATTACSNNGTTGDTYIAAYFASTCATVTTGGNAPMTAGGQSTMTCSGGTCTGSVSSGWKDNNDATVSTISAATYAVAMVFDNNNNWGTNDSPDTGDTICCTEQAISSSTTSASVSTANCTDL